MKEKISISPAATGQEIALKMISSGVAALPVLNGAQEVLGIATEQAILGAVHQGVDLEQITAATLLVKAPLIADISTTPGELIQMMLNNNCCSVVLIVNNGKYAGVVTRHMLMDIYTSPHYARFAQKDRKAPFVCQ